MNKFSNFLIILFAVVVIKCDTDELIICKLACAQKRTRDTFIPDPDDCHVYYHCHLSANGTYVSAKYNCPTEQHWRQDLLQCVPGAACVDPCQDPETQRAGFYRLSSGNCRVFYQCGHGISYQMCCPDNTSFDVSVGYCTVDDECAGTLCPSILPNPTEPPPPMRYNDTACINEFNVTLTVDPSNPAGYLEWISESSVWQARRCPKGTIFSGLQLCGCHNRSEDFPIGNDIHKECFLYASFDSKTFVDSSVFQNLIDQSCVNRQYDRAFGAGSAYFNGSCHVEVPAFQNKDFGQSMSICFWAKCTEPQCAEGGGVYNQMSFDEPSGTLFAGTRIWFAPAKVTWDFQDATNSAFYTSSSSLSDNPETWTHYCFVKWEASWTIYINNKIASQSQLPANFRLLMPQCPLSIGFDDFFGYFTGGIDELFVCETPFDDYLVDAVYTNQLSKLQAINLLP